MIFEKQLKNAIPVANSEFFPNLTCGNLRFFGVLKNVSLRFLEEYEVFVVEFFPHLFKIPWKRIPGSFGVMVVL